MALLILLIALLATAVAFVWSRNQVRERKELQFQRAVAKSRDTMELQLTSYLHVLLGLKGLFDSSHEVDAAEFRSYIEATTLRTDHPGIYDIGYILRVRPEERKSHRERMEQLGMRDYLPRFPEDDSTAYLLGYWDIFSPTIPGNLGVNLGGEPLRRETMERAARANRVAATPRLELRGLGDEPPIGIVLYLPTYRRGAPIGTPEEREKALLGFVFASFDMRKLLETIHNRTGEPQIDFEAYDGLTPSVENLWFDSDGVPRAIAANQGARSSLSQMVTLGGLEREWSFYYTALPGFGVGPAGERLPWGVLATGLILSAVLFGLAWKQARARARAEELTGEVRRSGAALVAEKERMDVTLRSIGEGVITVDAQQWIVLINRRAEEFTGRTSAEAEGRPLDEVLQLVDPHSRVRLPSPVRLVLEQGVSYNAVKPALLIARDGSHLLVMYGGAPIRDADGTATGAVVAFRDFTERARLVEEQSRASKLESLGILAGGIAHDFNNILALILGNISLAALLHKQGRPVGQRLEDAEKACARARELTQQLLTFARGGAPIRKTALLGETLRDSARFATTGSDVRCEYELPENLWPVEADTGQISQVVQNLVMNADQAMPKGGTVRVMAENHPLPDNNSLGLTAGRYVRFSVVDQGHGIPPEHLEKIFDPYFTTKQKGSGLGLTTTYSIVRHHDGAVTVDSQLGKGTRFDVYLPASDKTPGGSRQTPASLTQGEGTVLLMDDEPGILEMVGMLLDQLGYKIMTAAHGEEAVRLYQEAQTARQPIAAVILDLTIRGGLGGLETLQRLQALDPRVKAIVSSGYSNDPIMSNPQAFGFKAVVAKPYGMDQLAGTLHAVIHADEPVEFVKVIPPPTAQAEVVN